MGAELTIFSCFQLGLLGTEHHHHHLVNVHHLPKCQLFKAKFTTFQAVDQGKGKETKCIIMILQGWFQAETRLHIQGLKFTY
jgi:hypothetical protein